MSSVDASQIDALLTKAARALGADDPRTIDQRRADLFTDLLAGRSPIVDGKLRLGKGANVTVGVVVPIDTLAGLSDAPGELLDRVASIPAACVRELAAAPGTLFYRLLTDRLGNLLDVTEIGRFPSKRLRFALRVRDGECAFPTCAAPAERCDIDHVIPVPGGPTGGDNLRHLCRRHHRAKTFGVFGVINDDSGYRWHLRGQRVYSVDDAKLPTGHQSSSSRRPITGRKRTEHHCNIAFGQPLAEYGPT